MNALYQSIDAQDIVVKTITQDLKENVLSADEIAAVLSVGRSKYYMQVLANRPLVDECDASCWQSFFGLALGDVSKLLRVVLTHAAHNSQHAH